MKLSRRFTLTTAIVAIVLYAATSAHSDELQIQVEPQQAPQISEEATAQNQGSDEEWVMEIEPAAKVPTASAGSIVANSGATETGNAIKFDRAEYARIYNSIPFNRAEYEVNPSYRHDSTMEILTGNARHQTIVRHNFEHKQPVKQTPAPTRPSRILIPFNLPGLPFGSAFGFGLNAMQF